MADAEQNKQNVVGFYTMAFNEKQPEEAVKRYIGSEYIQHNPQAPDGPDAFIQFVKAFTGQFPELRVEIKRAIGEGDLVVTHSLLKTSPDDRGTAAADIFRLDENGKIVEHWDVLQPMPETSANDHPMF
jgi:predicted SnoaL-like aldol condensation-catalyzing enzyme